MDKKRVLICEDHAIISDGLQLLINTQPDLALLESVQQADDAIRSIAQVRPDVLVLDLNLKGSDGFSVLKASKNSYPEIVVIILTMYRDELLIEQAQKMGANAYLEKSAGKEELLQAMRMRPTDPFLLSRSLKAEEEARRKFRDHFAGKMKLTRREMEIIPHLVNGNTSNEIAGELNLSPLTVETHRKNIFKKLKIGNVVDLVNFAHENHLV
jgi:DNA-binding NarL/FixJ family response regulator